MYKDFYRLKAMPFQLTPDPAFFYAGPSHKRVLSYLQYGVHQGDGFIVVTGDIGTGKTTLIQTLLSDLKKEKNIVAAQLVSTQLESDDLLRMVSAAFGLSHEKLNKPSLLKNLENYFRKQAKQGKRILLIVDEAQNLPIQSLEELRMLSNYQSGNKALFQSFLVGQAEFRNLIRVDYLEQLRQRIIASYHLGALSADEISSYIIHRLKAAGWDNDPVLLDGAYSKIYDYTEGVPRRINTLCDRLFLVASLKEVHEIDALLVDEVQQEIDSEVHGRVVDRDKQGELKMVYKEGGGESGGKAAELERRLIILEGYINGIRDALIPGGSGVENQTKGRKNNKF